MRGLRDMPLGPVPLREPGPAKWRENNKKAVEKRYALYAYLVAAWPVVVAAAVAGVILVVLDQP